MTSQSTPSGKDSNNIAQTRQKLDADAALIKSLQALIEKTGTSDADADADLELLFQQLNAASDVADSVEGRIDSILANLDEVLRSLPQEDGEGTDIGAKETETPGGARREESDEQTKS